MSSTVAIPHERLDQISWLNNTNSERQVAGRPPISIEDAAKQLNLFPDQHTSAGRLHLTNGCITVGDLLQAELFSRNIGSLERDTSPNADLGNNTHVLDNSGTENITDRSPQPSVEDDVTQSEFRQILDRALSCLDEHLQFILRLRFGFFDDIVHTLDEIGLQLNISREYVRQLELKALAQLRENSNVRSLLDYYLQ
jgi:RNA polymerase sigma factor (sigma-70 family)